MTCAGGGSNTVWGRRYSSSWTQALQDGCAGRGLAGHRTLHYHSLGNSTLSSLQVSHLGCSSYQTVDMHACTGHKACISLKDTAAMPVRAEGMRTHCHAACYQCSGAKATVLFVQKPACAHLAIWMCTFRCSSLLSLLHPVLAHINRQV